jgi:protein associated with RNAse G/E
MSRDWLRVKVRGIYTTALTKLLLDHNYEIVQPSEEIVERFGLEAVERESDLIIRDRYDRQGVEAFGGVEAIDAFRSILREELVDVILRRRVDSCLDVEFPWASKMKLDEHRRAVAPTVQMHHFYKACGGEVSSAADMAERLLLGGRPAEEVEELLRRTLVPYFPFEGSEIGIEHVKLSGEILSLGKAVIETFNESLVRYTREMRSEGVYDGLGVEKESGDCAVTEAKLGEYYTVTKYFSKGGRFKGAYINLNTPVELYSSKTRYIDLEVDICLWPGGDVRVIDEELFERAVKELIITEKLLKLVKTKVNELLDCIGDGFS